MLRDQSRDCVLIDHLLFSVALQNHNEAVESADDTAHLKAVLKNTVMFCAC